MYNHHHHLNQEKNDHLASKTVFHPDRHLFLLGEVDPGDSGLVLSTDAKPRLKWTQELHGRFIDAVNQLGGAEKATPKAVMRLMGIPGLTLYHLKSHLQKYRLSKNLQGQDNIAIADAGCALTSNRTSGLSGLPMSDTKIGSQMNETMQITEALLMQHEVQRQLKEQLEVQRHLQQRIEAQGRYLQSVLEKAQQTLDSQNLGSNGLNPQVSNGCADRSMDSCLISRTHGFKDGSNDFDGVRKKGREFKDPNLEERRSSKRPAIGLSLVTAQLDLNSQYDIDVVQEGSKGQFDLNGFSWNRE